MTIVYFNNSPYAVVESGQLAAIIASLMSRHGFLLVMEVDGIIYVETWKQAAISRASSPA